MTKNEYLLICLVEECGEVVQAATKALRFGLEDINPCTGETNKSAIQKELNDIAAIVTMLRRDNIIDDNFTKSPTEKIKKVEKWMQYSKDKNVIKELKK